MKKLFKMLLIMCMIVSINLSYADCNWSSIEEVEGGYLYSTDCHIKVGKLVKESKLREEQVKELNKTIELKDLSLSKANERIDNWRNTTYELEDRIMKQRKWSIYNDYLYFGGGIALTILSAWAFGQVNK